MDLIHIHQTRRMVDQVLKHQLFELFDDQCERDLLAGLIHKGRKVRSGFVLSFGQGSQLARFALGVELLHAASVLVDDIIDGDSIRHGSATAADRLGAEDAALISHKAGSTALKLFFEWPRLGKIGLDTYVQMTNGELHDSLIWRLQPAQLKDYPANIFQKTASLFAFVFEGAAILSGVDSEKARKLGWKFGELYQVSNDYFDARPENFERRNEHRKMTRVTLSMPVVLYCEHFGTNDIERWIEKKYLSFDEHIEFLRHIWSPTVKQLASDKFEKTHANLLDELASSLCPREVNDSVSRVAAALINREFWYHHV